MTLDSLDSFDFEGDSFDGYDPLAELDDVLSTLPSEDAIDTAEAEMESAPEQATEAPAEERIAKLLVQMKSRKRVILGILAYLEQPQPAADLAAKVEELQTYDFSVFNATNYSNALQDAGAIAKCDKDGVLLGADYKQAPEIVEIDGIEYYKPIPCPEIYWQTTEAGMKVLEEDDPFGRMLSTIDTDKPEYKEIFLETLRYCDQGEGKSTLDVQEYLRGLDKFEGIRVFASRYLIRMEEAGAVLWAGSWTTTEVGRKGLAHYANDEEE